MSAQRGLIGARARPAAAATQSANLASYDHHRLSCPGMIIVDSVTDRVYANSGSHRGDCAPPRRTEPSQLFRLDQRHYGLYGMIEQLNGQYVDSRITALANAELKPGASAATVSQFSLPLKPDMPRWAKINVARKVDRYSLREQNDRNPLGPPLGRRLYRHVSARAGRRGPPIRGVRQSPLELLPQTVRYDLAGDSRRAQPVAQRRTLAYRMVFTTGGSTPSRPASDYESIVAFLGLRNNRNCLP